uniref:Myosin light chain kinase 2, skeletal/cardiac muscle-like n=1 Tax=Sinocyclocheilus grahami TaxID=75366 RepID=A0A672K612_SINGR
MNTVEKKNMPTNQNDVSKLIIAASVVTQRTPGIAPLKTEAQDDRKVSPPNTKTPIPVTKIVVLPDTIGPKHTEAVNVTLPNHTVPKTTGLVAPLMPQCTASLVPNNPPSVPTDATPIQTFPKTSLGPPVATAQSSGKSSVNKPTTKTSSQDATLLPPSHKLPKTMGLNDMALNEIQVMNQLNHPNVLQLYEAFERSLSFLFSVEGGELFERIVDESCPLTEVDTMVFVKQICEGVQYMHQMYVLHLDLKPENILLVDRSSHQVKIIDFGLARRYKPREKLKVSFGTPEFLAPEVVNFDFVSFPTDMWTLGVVTYMLLSGLSPFLGDDDSQTLNNVLMGNWYFDEDAFKHVSAEARDFVSNLLIRERSGRLSATQCLKHPWLNNITEKAKSSNIVLKSQVLLKKYMARRMWKKNYIAVAAANRFKKIGSSGLLTALGI